MRSKHVHEELSDYIDGESANRREVERHLQSCSECAQHHMDLLKLSNVLRTMPTLAVGPEFTDGVLARVDITTPMPRWQARLVFFPKSVLAMAAALAFVALGAWFSLQSNQASPSSGNELVVNEAWLDDENVIAAVGDLPNTEEFVDSFATDDLEEDLMFEDDPSIEALMDSLAAAVEGGSDQPAWYEADDILSVIELLAEEDVKVLTELTQNHWDEV